MFNVRMNRWLAALLMAGALFLIAPAVWAVDIAPTDAYAGPSKPKPVLASNTKLLIGKEYQVTVKPAARGGMRLGSVFEIAALDKDTWLVIAATSDTAGYLWGICDLEGRYIVSKLTAGSGTQKVQLKANQLYAVYFEFTGSKDVSATYKIKLQ